MARKLRGITMQLFISITLIKSLLPRWVDLTDRPPFERSTHGSCNSCSVPYWCPCQKEPWWIQGWKDSQYLLAASIDLYVSFMSLVQNKLMAIFLQGCISLAVSRLSRIVTSSYTDFQASWLDLFPVILLTLKHTWNSNVAQDYTYYFVPAPWLSVKLLRLLQNYQPPEDPGVRPVPWGLIMIIIHIYK